MKKALSALLALTMLLALLPMGALALPVAAAENTVNLDNVFQANLSFLDQYYTLNTEYMVQKLCGVLYDWEKAEANNYAPMPMPADEFETILYQYFAPTAEQLEDIRNYPYYDDATGDTKPFYDTATKTYQIFFVGGFGGALPNREYLGYVETDNGYAVFYQHLTYLYLPDDEAIWQELEALEWPETYTYDGVVYTNGPDGYVALASRDAYGNRYDVQYNDGILRVLSQTPYTPVPADELDFTIDDNGVTITGYIGSANIVVLPDIINDVAVTAVDGAFSWNGDLQGVLISDSITTIEPDSFGYCDNLNHFLVSKGHETLCAVDGVLMSKDKTELIQYPAGKHDTTYEVPAEVRKVYNYAFGGNDRIRTVVFQEGVEEIGMRAFGSCSRLSAIEVNKNNETYASADGVLFNKDMTVLIQCPAGKKGEYVIPDGVVTVSACAFEKCTGLMAVTIPNTVKMIDYYAFLDCMGLSTVVIPNGVTFVGQMAFAYCYNLKNIVLPDTLESVGYYLADYSDNLTDVWYTGTKAQAEAMNLQENTYLMGATWHYNVCAEHTYSNGCDATCSKCDWTRETAHDYAAATCTKAKTCKNCGATEGKKLGHKYTNDCDASCNRCKATRTVSHSYEKKTTKATLTKDGTIKNVCKKCGYTASKVTTIYKASKVSLSTTSYTYNGSAKKPTVIVKDSKGKTISKSYYTVTYAGGRKNVGEYKVTVKFKGNYSGTKTLTFKINPVKTTVKATAAKKSLKLTIGKKSTQVTGYEVQYSTSKSFKTYKTKKISSYKTTSTTLTGLSAKKTYYVRVRTYKTVNGKKYYSGWSTVVSKKTK